MVFLLEVPQKKMPAQPAPNKSCSLLSQEENEQVFRLLGARCQTLSTSVIQLFYTEPPNHSRWVKKDSGILCFVKDNFRKNYFFRLYCLKKGVMVWEQELYNNMDYSTPCPFLHTFEGEEYMVAFNFAHNLEARDMKEVVLSKIEAKRRREERKQRNSRNIGYPSYNSTPNTVPQNNMNFIVPDKPKGNDYGSKKSKKQKDKITKADISQPSDFRHLCHVGFDPNTGFDMNSSEDVDPHLKQFFEKAGVSNKQLQDKDTREFIYDFINSHGGIDVAKEEVVKQIRKPPPPIPGSQQPEPPPVPSRTQYRTAPKPPTTSITPSRPPPPSPAVTQERAPAPAAAAAAPPPPPPPPPATVAPPAPPMMAPPPPMGDFSAGSAGPDPRSKLLESIREGKALKPVEVDRRADDARGNLMNEIRQGRQLKPAMEREVKPIAAQETGTDLAGALARALAERSRAIHSEDDTDSSSDSNDDEWDN